MGLGDYAQAPDHTPQKTRSKPSQARNYSPRTHEAGTKQFEFEFEFEFGLP